MKPRRALITALSGCHFDFSDNSAFLLSRREVIPAIYPQCVCAVVCLHGVDYCTVYEIHLWPNRGLWRRQSGFSLRRRRDKGYTAVIRHFNSRRAVGGERSYTLTLKMMAEALD